MSREEAALVQLKLQLESLISIAKNCLATAKLLEGKPSTSAAPRAAPPARRSGLVTDQVLGELPGDLRGKLYAKLQDYGVVSVTADWLGTEDFARVSEAVTAMGGTWIREGKQSRWEVPIPAGGEVEG